MAAGAVFFREAVPGVSAVRYCIGHYVAGPGSVFAVTRVQLSCPDGTEIRRPRAVRMPASSGAVEVVGEAVRIERALAAGVLKRCSDCSEAKPTDLFERAGSGWRRACRACTDAQQRVYRRCRPTEDANDPR